MPIIRKIKVFFTDYRGEIKIFLQRKNMIIINQYLLKKMPLEETIFTRKVYNHLIY